MPIARLLWLPASQPGAPLVLQQVSKSGEDGNDGDSGDDDQSGDGDVDDDDGDDIITMIGICQSHLLIIAVSAEFESSLAIVSQLGVTHPRTICRAGSNNYNPRKNIFW